MIRPLRTLLARERKPSILPMDREAAFQRARLRPARCAGSEARRRIAAGIATGALAGLLVLALTAWPGLLL